MSEDEDAMMMDDEGNSIATNMCVRPDVGFAYRPRGPESVNGSVTGNSFVLPRPVGVKDREDMMEDDDISTLTEYSMEEDDDNVSQTTTNTALLSVVTTGTDSTTVPTRNFPAETRQRVTKRPMLKENALLRDNSHFKRRRMA